MPLSKHILGMNARNYLYIRPFNSRKKMNLADDKLLTKELLIRHHIPTPKLLKAFRSREEVRDFDWNLPAPACAGRQAGLPVDGWVIKPARGYGGAGILPIASWNGEKAISVTGRTYTVRDLRAHLLDILDGSFSLSFLPDHAFIEQLVTPDPFFKKLAPVGLADIRLIVFQKIPVMAMMRLPTKESGGKANLHQGGVAVGIDLRRGMTVAAIHHNRLIDTLPETGVSVTGIRVPGWDDIMLLGAKTQAVCGLGYAGVDIILDEHLGPAVLEVNARPGLSIQVANQESLRTRLERVEDIAAPTPERGVEIAQSLFSTGDDPTPLTPKVLTVIQPVKIVTASATRKIEAKLDTGAYRTSIDRELAEQLELPTIQEKIEVKSASGITNRLLVELTFMLAGRKIKTLGTIADRSKLMYPMIIGRRDLNGFLIEPSVGPNRQDIEELEKN